MGQNSKKIAVTILTLLTIFLGLTFAVSRHNRSRPGADLGVFAAISGRVEMRPSTGRIWVNPTVGSAAPSGISIRVGSGGSATITNDQHELSLGPDTDISSNWKKNDLDIRLLSGELLYKKLNGRSRDSIMTEFAIVGAIEPASFVLSKPAASNFVVVSPKTGEITIEQFGVSRRLSLDSPPVVLAAQNVDAIWLESPTPEMVLPSVEGFAAVIFSWGEDHKGSNVKEPPNMGSILIRNLATGELHTISNTHSRSEYTLPSGSYSWVVTSGDLATNSRRFHISATAPEVAHSPSDIPETTSTSTTVLANSQKITAQQESTPPAAPITASPAPVAPILPVSAIPAKAETVLSVPPDVKLPSAEVKVIAEPKVNAEAQENAEAKVNTEPATVKILLPHKGKQIPFSKIAEERVHWKSTGTVDSYELDIVGSSGNPSLHFIPLGGRSRQKLLLLPPGRYTVRMRTVVGSDATKVFGDWVESFFDVIQTESGELKPQNLTFEITKGGKPPTINVHWEKGAAPQYRVKMTSVDDYTTIVIVKKQKISLKMPKSGKAVISVCALDANMSVRGCAPDLSIP